MPRTSERVTTIHIGEMAVGSKPMAVRTVLGSCVSACLFDPVARVGGMNHFLLADFNPASRTGSEARFGLHAMELLINGMMRLGAERRRIVAKAFGGANIIPGMSSPTVGERNVSFLESFLALEKIRLASHYFGGDSAIQVVFHTHTGRAFMRSVGERALRETILEESRAYRSRPATGDVTLF